MRGSILASQTLGRPPLHPNGHHHDNWDMMAIGLAAGSLARSNREAIEQASYEQRLSSYEEQLTMLQAAFIGQGHDPGMARWMAQQELGAPPSPPPPPEPNPVDQFFRLIIWGFAIFVLGAAFLNVYVFHTF